MGKKPIGFLAREEAEIQEKEVEVKNVKKSFLDMIAYLQLERKEYLQELKLEEEIRKALVRLYKKLRKLEQKINRRYALAAQYEGLMQESPKKALQLLDQIAVLDQEIIPEGNKLFKEISQHALPEVAVLYKEMELTDEQRQQIRILAGTLNSTLSSLMARIQQAVQSQLVENARRTILLNHPELK